MISESDEKKLSTLGWRRVCRYLFRLLIPVVFFIYAFQVIKPQDVAYALERMRWPWFLVGSLCILVLNYLCSLRTKALITKEKNSLVLLWNIHAMSSFVAGFFPLRAGELSYAYYLRKYCSIPATEGIAILVTVRFVEYLILLIFICCLSILGIFVNQSSLSYVVFLVILVNLIIIILLFLKAHFVINSLKLLGTKIIYKFFVGNIANSLSRRIENLSDDIKRVVPINLSRIILLLSILIVLLRHAFVLSMLVSMGVQINVSLIVLLFAFLYVAKFIQGFGSFGSQEVSIVGALILNGRAQFEALPIAIGTHILQWVPILVCGCLAWLALRAWPYLFAAGDQEKLRDQIS